MTIKQILTQLEKSDHPVAKPLYKGADFKVLIIGFKSGMKLKDHLAHVSSKLTVISGTVIYKQHETEIELQSLMKLRYR